MEGGYGDNQFPSTNHHIMTEISMAKILIPSPHPSPLERLCRNQREPTSASTRDRRSGDEALDLPARSPALRDEGRAETFHRSALGCQAHEKKPVSNKADYP